MRFYEIEIQSIPKIIFACSVDTRKHRNYYNHKPDFLEISLCEEGRILVKNLDGTEAIQCPGMLGMINSDMAAHTCAYNNERQKHTTVAMRVKYTLKLHNSEAECDIQALKERVKDRNIVLLPLREYVWEEYDRILGILKKIVLRNASDSPADKLDAIGLWFQLLSIVTEFTLRKLDSSQRQLPPSELMYASKADAYINVHYTEPVTIEDIAAQLGISAGYLHRIFRHVKNCSILDCLNRKRVIAAIELMENRNLSLKEAAYNVGIEDPA